jgi:hypothetical protein
VLLITTLFYNTKYGKLKNNLILPTLTKIKNKLVIFLGHLRPFVTKLNFRVNHTYLGCKLGMIKLRQMKTPFRHILWLRINKQRILIFNKHQAVLLEQHQHKHSRSSWFESRPVPTAVSASFHANARTVPYQTQPRLISPVHFTVTSTQTIIILHRMSRYNGSYSRHPELKTRSDRISRQNMHCSPHFPRRISVWYSGTGYDRILCRSPPFIIHCHHFIWRYLIINRQCATKQTMNRSHIQLFH